MSSLLKVWLMVFATSVASACGSSEPEKVSWRAVTSEAGGYSVQMPGEPKQTIEVQQSIAGGLSIPMSIVDLRGQGVCMAGYTDYPPSALSLPVEQLLDDAAKNAVDSARSTEVSRKRIELNGYHGVEVEMKPPNNKFTSSGRAISRLYWVPPRRLYLTIIAGPEQSELYQGKATFLDSFKLLPKG